MLQFKQKIKAFFSGFFNAFNITAYKELKELTLLKERIEEIDIRDTKKRRELTSLFVERHENFKRKYYPFP